MQRPGRFGFQLTGPAPSHAEAKCVVAFVNVTCNSPFWITEAWTRRAAMAVVNPRTNKTRSVKLVEPSTASVEHALRNPPPRHVACGLTMAWRPPYPQRHDSDTILGLAWGGWYL